MIDLKGKVAVVFGLANKRSIAYSVAQKLAEAGATLVLSYQSERLQREADDLLEELGQTGVGRAFRCDVSRDEEIDAVFAQIAAAFPIPKIDILIHSVAFAPADALKNDFLLTSREDFRIAHDISVYSLIALARAAAPLMSDGGAILTLTYYGSEKVFPNYNVMGVAKAALESVVRYLAASLGPKNIRVNAISAGRSAPWPRAASATSTRFWTPSRCARRCTETWNRPKSATPLSSSARRWPAASPARSPSSIAASTLPESNSEFMQSKAQRRPI